MSRRRNCSSSRSGSWWRCSRWRPSALATTHGGEGIWGPTSDKTITYAMFILIGLFPVLIIVFSLIQALARPPQARARQDAAKRRASAAEWKGGW